MPEERVPVWLRDVELTPGSERQEAIVAAAHQVAESASTELALDLVLLAHGVPQDRAFAAITTAITGEDSTFGCRIEDLETHIAAAVTVAALVDSDSDLGSLTSEAVLSAGWSELTPSVPDLRSLSSAALERRSEAIRERSQIAITTDLPGAIKAIPKFPDDAGATTHSEAAELAGALEKALQTVKRSLDQASRRVNARLDATDEELDLLWWAFSGYSEIENLRWSDLAHKRRPIVLAIEFVEMLRFSIRPPSTNALITRLLSPDADAALDVAAVVADACSSGVDVPRVDGHQLLPLLSSLSECHAMDGKPTWPDSVSRWGINVNRDVVQLEISVQMVRELTMLRAMG